MLFTALVFFGGCVHEVAERCPSCAVIDARHPELPELKRGARRLFVLVPGVLGYGWEWDEAARALAASPDADFVVFWWQPWGNLRTAADELRAALAAALWYSPRRVREVNVIGHSVGGMILAHALDGLPLPPGKKLRALTIGAPFAGMAGPPVYEEDALGSPAMITVMGQFRRYPKPPKGVEVIEYVTAYPSDPVMQPRWGHTPAPPEIGPAGARRVAVDPRLDHNRLVSKIVIELLTKGAPPAVIAP